MGKKASTEDSKGQVENLLTELGKKIDQLLVETKDARVEVTDEIEKKINDLKKKKEKLQADFDSYKDKHEDKWQEAKGHLTGALEELKKAIAAVFNK